MASLFPPFDAISVGPHELQASLPLFGWHRIGSCTVTADESFVFAASGSYDVWDHQGTFDLRLSLDDRNPATASGPCTITNAGTTTTGTYTRTNAALSFTDGHHTITVTPGQPGPVFAISGYPSVRVVP